MLDYYAIYRIFIFINQALNYIYANQKRFNIIIITHYTLPLHLLPYVLEFIQILYLSSAQTFS